MNALTPAMLFAQAPTWTDKEVLTTVVSIIVALVTLGGIAIRIATSLSQRRARKAEVEKLQIQNELESLRNSVVSGDLKDVEKKLDVAQQEAAVQVKTAEDLQHTLAEAKAAVDHHQAELSSERRRIQNALKKDGHTWIEKVKSSAPDFKPLDPDGRRMPVISVLNLKGGVGKTTITANLGAALDAIGYRTLLIDLDLQGSLTGLYLADGEQEKLDKDRHLLGDFLDASFDAEYPNLNDYTSPVLADQKSAIVPTTDNLAYAETNLTIRWLLREGKDPRFLLRRELQLKKITNNYDIVLLDCPPIINMCCVNALAASDYVLIPILPSKQATARVTVLLKRLKEFRDNINFDLKVLGILANRTHWSELTNDEKNRLSALRDDCLNMWGTEVPLMETSIRQTTEIRAAEDEHRPLQADSEIFAIFKDLAREVDSRIPAFCRAQPASHRTAKEVEA